MTGGSFHRIALFYYYTGELSTSPYANQTEQERSDEDIDPGRR